ncbi:Polyamine transporter 4 [Pseudocercospora fuligena]|uniref:Polyamine transporter 4 n=1 Tax=Pseudocercospora fuligena TaxID=685502 RepID=A0A8H6VD44_9PEZI|nr:Polyamine transporter 4 [Pseudocercospora fuligena]
MAIFVMSVQMGPAFGPLIGGFVTENISWRWTQWVILFGIAIVLTITMLMHETYKTAILQARAKRMGIDGPPREERTAAQSIKFFARQTLIRPMHMTFTEPIVTFFDIYTAFLFGLLNAFFAAFSWVFENTYGFNLGAVGLTYLGQAVGSIIGCAVIIYTSKVVWAKETDRLKESDPNARLPPERKLIIAKIGAVLLPIGLFWYGWTAQHNVHWISPVIAEGFFSCANILIFTCALMFLQDCYGAKYGASAASSNTFARYLTAFAFPLFAIQMFEGVGTGWACSILGFFSILLIPIPFLFDKYGERIRQKSKYQPDE